MVIGSDKNITTANVTQLHNNIPKILSKINIVLKEYAIKIIVKHG